MKSHASSTTPKHLQITLVGVLSANILYGFVQTLYYMTQQAATNDNFSAFMGNIVTGFVYPAVLACIAYALITRKISVLQKLFESAIVVACTVFLSALVSSAVMAALSGFMLYEDAWMTLGPTLFFVIEGALVTVPVLGYLLYARRKKQW